MAVVNQLRVVTSEPPVAYHAAALRFEQSPNEVGVHAALLL